MEFGPFPSRASPTPNRKLPQHAQTPNPHLPDLVASAIAPQNMGFMGLSGKSSATLLDVRIFLDNGSVDDDEHGLE